MGGQSVATLSTHFSWKQVKWLVSNFLSALKALKQRNFLAACDKTYKHASLKIVANLLRLCLFVCVCCCAIVWKKVKSRPLWLVFKKAQKRFLSTQHHCSSILSMLKILESMTQDAVKAIFIIQVPVTSSHLLYPPSTPYPTPTLPFPSLLHPLTHRIIPPSPFSINPWSATITFPSVSGELRDVRLGCKQTKNKKMRTRIKREEWCYCCCLYYIFESHVFSLGIGT